MSGREQYAQPTYRVHLGKMELEPVDFSLVKRIVVQDANFEVPVASYTVFAVQQFDTRRKAILADLRGTQVNRSTRDWPSKRVSRTLPNSLIKRLSRVAPAIVELIMQNARGLWWEKTEGDNPARVREPKAWWDKSQPGQATQLLTGRLQRVFWRGIPVT